MKKSERDYANPHPGSYLLTVSLAQQGYRLSTFCRSLMKAENREACKADLEAYMTSFGLTDAEKGMVRAKDWLAIARYGVNHFLVFRLASLFGDGLVGTAAQMRGESLDDFKRSRRVWEDR